jgi:preprotein translocase subunit SecA
MRSVRSSLSLRSLFRRRSSAKPTVGDVNRLRAQYQRLDDRALAEAGRRAGSLAEIVGVTAVVASRVLGLQMFDEQTAAALALAHGHVVEMQTGEGKTLAAVPAVAWHARTHEGVHVLTANDYLATRDAAWMRGIYERLGLSVASIDRTMDAAARRTAYLADVTYATANEVGFDYLRDRLACRIDEQVHRPFHAAVIDEADSILIDEARIPLVIAGGAADAPALVEQADRLVRELVPGRHFTVEPHGDNVVLTAPGVTVVERALGCANLFDPGSLPVHTAVQDALHAHVLLRKDVDYVVSRGAVLSIDEFKGRLVPERRWPAGLQTALEAKEEVHRRTQGRVLGSITIEHLVAMYPHVCGMTGTAATQTDEFREVYGLDVVVVPTHAPVIRDDLPDEVFATKVDKEAAVLAEIRAVHATGRPVLVGTSSVEESERLSRAIGETPHNVLNARHEAEEAAIIARAGERGAVTISTNMAGRGVDIRLGPGVSALGGLHVIGTTRHDSRRIDHQLRGRAGRQGDPGSSRFFVSREDPLIARHQGDDPDVTPDQYQRMVEGRHLDGRLFLRKYEAVVEGQRQAIAARRQAVLDGERASASDRDRLVTLATIDELWADYLAAIAELRSGTPWISLGYGSPLSHYLSQVHTMFGQLEQTIESEVAARLSQSESIAVAPSQRGATWTYLTTDEPFGPMTERIMRRVVKLIRPRRP